MEFINRIELCGIIGRVHLQQICSQTAFSFSLVTETSFRDRDGTPVIETSWHNVYAW